MTQIYNKKSHKYTAADRATLSKLYRAGNSDADIAEILGRTEKAIQCQRVKQGLKKKRGRVPRVEPKPVTKGAKYTRYMKPRTEFSLLWGLIKFTKA